MNEEWRAVKGYEGLYEVSNMGRVRSLDRRVKTRSPGAEDFFRAGRTIAPKQRHGGYLGVQLWRDGNVRQICIHRLVAQAFVPNPHNLPQVNHKDENKLNNRADNLEWCVPKYNANYGNRNEKMSRNNPLRKRVAQYTQVGELIRIYDSIRKTREYGYSPALISKQINGKANSAYGCKWVVLPKESEEE